MNGKQRTIVLPSSTITHLNFIVASVSEFAVKYTKVWLEKGGGGAIVISLNELLKHKNRYKI